MLPSIALPQRSIRFRHRSFMAFVLAPEPPIANWLVELDKWSRSSPGFFVGRATVLDLFQELEFRSLVPRLPPADGNVAAPAPTATAQARPGQLALGLEPSASEARISSSSPLRSSGGSTTMRSSPGISRGDTASRAAVTGPASSTTSGRGAGSSRG